MMKKITVKEIEKNKERIATTTKFLLDYDYPTVKIKRGDKVLIQQRNNVEDLLKHLKNKYPDWTIVDKYNFE